MHLEILTPDSKVFNGEILSVNLPGTQGYFEIHPKHAAIISTLDKGAIKITTSGSKTEEFIVDGGVVEVLNDKIIVLAEALL